jgi:hypothetical protein
MRMRFAGIEAERRGSSHRTGFLPASPLGEVRRPMRLTGILNHHQPKPFRQFEDRVHLGGLAVQMHRDNRRHAPSRIALYQMPGSLIQAALILQVFQEFLRIHVVGALVHVDKHRPRASLRDCFSGRDKGIGDGYYHIAFNYTRRHECEAESVGAAAHTHTFAGIAKRGELALKRFHHRSADKARSIQRRREHVHQLLP